jgi:8-oxo-dGTP pyrophosphatase MutT (NUDIX family)
MPERWKTLECKIDPLGGPFALRRELALLPSRGIVHEFIMLESPDWVNVVAETERGTLVMVRQHRLGSDEVELEIPGGLVDPEDPGPLEAAKRELEEETGYQGMSWYRIGVVYPNPALQTNRCYTFLAEGCRPHGPPRPDVKESIDVVEVPLYSLKELIQEGRIAHALALNGLFWYFLHRGLVGLG